MKFFVVLILSVLIYESIAESYIKMPEKGRQELIQRIRNFELTFSDSNYSPYFKKLVQGLASCMTTNECRNLIARITVAVFLFPRKKKYLHKI